MGAHVKCHGGSGSSQEIHDFCLEFVDWLEADGLCVGEAAPFGLGEDFTWLHPAQ